MLCGDRFANLDDDMNLAEDYLKFCTKFVLEHCSKDVDFFASFKQDDGSKNSVRGVAAPGFA